MQAATAKVSGDQHLYHPLLKDVPMLQIHQVFPTAPLQRSWQLPDRCLEWETCEQIFFPRTLGFEEHTKQLLTLLPLRFDPIVLIQQISKEIFFVEFTHQPVLHNIFAVVHKQVHDRFGNLISNGFADDVEVGRDEGADEFCFQGLPLGEFGVALGGLRLLVRVAI